MNNAHVFVHAHVYVVVIHLCLHLVILIPLLLPTSYMYMLRHAYIYPFFQYWCSVRCARHQHYFTLSTRCTLYNTYCQHMSRANYLCLYLEEVCPHLILEKSEKPGSKLIMNAFMEEFLPHLELLTCMDDPVNTYTCLLIIGGKVGFALQVAVYNASRVSASPTLYVSPWCARTPSWRLIVQNMCSPSYLQLHIHIHP